jgi:hypothetical protein
MINLMRKNWAEHLTGSVQTRNEYKILQIREEEITWKT